MRYQGHHESILLNRGQTKLTYKPNPRGFDRLSRNVILRILWQRFMKFEVEK